jgi:hypothetical protein
MSSGLVETLIKVLRNFLIMPNYQLADAKSSNRILKRVQGEEAADDC